VSVFAELGHGVLRVSSIIVLPTADGQDHVEAIVFNLPPDLAGTLGLNYSILSNSCLRQKLSVLINASNMMANGVDTHLGNFWGHPIVLLSSRKL
jgi:hypothetical protein